MAFCEIKRTRGGRRHNRPCKTPIKSAKNLPPESSPPWSRIKSLGDDLGKARQAVRLWLLTTLRDKLIKIGAKVTKHSKYVTFQLAEVAVTRNLFAAILDRIARLAIPPPVLVCGMPA